MTDSNLSLTRGVYWPRDIKPTAVAHAFRHVTGMDLAVSFCPQRRRAVQAGGNVGLWPRRMAERFDHVDTFEPEPLTFECLKRNVAAFPNITARHMALGEATGQTGIIRESLASHHLSEGEGITVAPLDSFGFDDVDFIQLDVEGYELRALTGGEQTIRRCRPIIQLELRGFSESYGGSDEQIMAFLTRCGYRVAAELVQSDTVFAPEELVIPQSFARVAEAAKLKVRNLAKAVLPGRASH